MVQIAAGSAAAQQQRQQQQRMLQFEMSTASVGVAERCAPLDVEILLHRPDMPSDANRAMLHNICQRQRKNAVSNRLWSYVCSTIRMSHQQQRTRLRHPATNLLLVKDENSRLLREQRVLVEREQAKREAAIVLAHGRAQAMNGALERGKQDVACVDVRGALVKHVLPLTAVSFAIQPPWIGAAAAAAGQSMRFGVAFDELRVPPSLFATSLHTPATKFSVYPLYLAMCDTRIASLVDDEDLTPVQGAVVGVQFGELVARLSRHGIPATRVVELLQNLLAIASTHVGRDREALLAGLATRAIHPGQQLERIDCWAVPPSESFPHVAAGYNSSTVTSSSTTIYKFLPMGTSRGS